MAMIDQTAGMPTDTLDVSMDPRAWEKIRALQRSGQADLFTKVVTAYLRSTPHFALTMRTALRERNAPAFGQATHTLKSSSAAVGALRLAALCREGEALARGGHLTGADDLLAHIEAELKKVEQVLRHELAADPR